MSEPFYPCQIRRCAEEVTLPANMLRVCNGEPICEECADNWRDLPKFVPPHEAKITGLQAKLDETVKALDEIREMSNPDWHASRGCNSETLDDINKIVRDAMERIK